MKIAPPPAPALSADLGRFMIRVLRLEQLEIGRSWTYQRVRSPFWRWYVNDRPGAVIHWRGGRHQLLPGAAHLIPAWFTFDCLPPPQPVRHLYAHIDIPYLLPKAVAAHLSQPIAITLDAAERRACLLPAGVGSIAPETICRLTAVIMASVSRMLADRPALLAALAISDSDPIDQVQREIDGNLSEALSISRLALRCGMTTDVFIRRFRAHVGVTPGQYLISRRIAAAAELLLSTELTIEALAVRCGFSERAHFTRTFTHRMGVSPGRYRSQGR